jgi:transposase
MKSNEEVKKEIERLINRRKNLGQQRVSCANLGRGVTDSILRDMERIDDKIDVLESLLEE